MHLLLFLLQSTNAQLYITTVSAQLSITTVSLYTTYTLTCFDISMFRHFYVINRDFYICAMYRVKYVCTTYRHTYHVSTIVPCMYICTRMQVHPFPVSHRFSQPQFHFSIHNALIRVFFHDSFSSETLQWVFAVQLDSVLPWFNCSSPVSVLRKC
jgi:hypothetical protein